MGTEEKPNSNVEHFGFDDKVDVQESSFILIPDGEAIFTITKLEKDRKEMGQFGKCYVAIVTFLVTSMQEGNTKAEIDVHFPLVKEMGWKILQLATSIGFRKHGDGPSIDPAWWGKFVGETGRCVIGHRTGKPKKEGQKPRIFNDIEEFLAPEAEADKLKFD